MMMQILKWMKEETLRLYPAFIYFCVAFSLIRFTTALARRPGEAAEYTYSMVIIGALIMVKILVIVDHFPFINEFPNKPMTYNIVWKSWIYGIAVILAGILDLFLHPIIHLHGLDFAINHVHRELVSPFFWSTMLWILLLFFIYIVFTEISRVLGPTKLKHMFFGERIKKAFKTHNQN